MTVLQRGGKPAVTRYKVLQSYAGGAVSLVECRLMTGRTHQIRVHMTARGHALLGDPLYGRRGTRRASGRTAGLPEAVTTFPRQALHAQSLAFRHPVTGEWLRFTSELPTDMKNLTDTLEKL